MDSFLWFPGGWADRLLLDLSAQGSLSLFRGLRPSLRSKFRHRRRAQPFLAPGSSLRTIATTPARGGKTPEVRMAAIAEDAAPWEAVGPPVVAGCLVRPLRDVV